MKRHFFIFLLLVPSALILQAVPPAWWTAPDTSIIEGGTTVNNYAPANHGQLKHVAQQASEYLDATLFQVGGAGTSIDNMVATFSPTNNFSPINLGQLKAVAKPFYDRLGAVGLTISYPWTTITTDDLNYAPANIGQLKNVFSFDIDTWIAIDADTGGADDLPDWWENYWFGDLTTATANGSFSTSNYTYLLEFLTGQNPTVLDTSSTGGLFVIYTGLENM